MPNFFDPVYWAGVPMGLLFGLGGYMHFAEPYPYVTMMKGLPFPRLHPAIVTVSGFVEIGTGLALLGSPSTKVVDWTIFLLVAITPANINMYVNDAPFGDWHFTPKDHLYRGMAQVAFFGWLWALRSVYVARENSTKLD